MNTREESIKSREFATNIRMSQWVAALQERAESGETADAFCLRKGIGEHKYYYWQQKLRKVAGEQLAKRSEESSQIAVRSFAEVKVTEPSLAGSIGRNQICIETSSFKITAGSEYPAETFITVLCEIARLC